MTKNWCIENNFSIFLIAVEKQNALAWLLDREHF